MIDTPRLHLRKPTVEDLPPAQAFYATERSKFVGGPADHGESWRLAAMFLGHWMLRGYGLFTVVTRDTGRAIGLVGPWYPGDWPDHELGWQIWDTQDEGQGYATEAAKAARGWARTTLNWTRIVSYIAPENTGSIAVANRLGAALSDLPHPPGKPCQVFRHPEGET